VSFEPSILSAWERADEIQIETSRGPGTAVHKTTIWIVVVDGQAFVRSVRGPAGRWYRELVAQPQGAVQLDGQRQAVRAVAATDEPTIGRVSQALEQKYRQRWPGPTAAMLRAETLPTTLRLEPL